MSLHRILPILAFAAAAAAEHGDDGFMPYLGKGPTRTDYDNPQWRKNAEKIAAAEAALTPEQKAERQRQNNQRKKLTKRERQELAKKGKR